MTSSLLIGLGNPGKEYAGNRHNIGFMILDAIVETHHFSAWKKAFGGQISEGTLAGQKVYAFKPMEFMNNSGGPGGKAVRFYKIALEHVFVFHDELDLPLGRLRVKRGGGNGGHNGLKSLDMHLSPDYWRVRVGIAHPGDKDLVSDHVLSDFTKEEARMAQAVIEQISKNIASLIKGNDSIFMTKIASAMQGE